MGYVMFNQKSSKDYGLEVELIPDYVVAERDYDVVHVPGRNGDVIIRGGNSRFYKNSHRDYAISAIDKKCKFIDLAKRIRNWVYSKPGYCYLGDSYEPEYYRLGFPEGELSIMNYQNEAARVQLSFNCKPQRFLVSGTQIISNIQNGASITNPTDEIALPVIYVNGNEGSSGKIVINESSIEIPKIRDKMIIDCENQDAYLYSVNGNTPLGNSIRLNSRREYPSLKPGKQTISFSGGIKSLGIKPMWWTT